MKPKNFIAAAVAAAGLYAIIKLSKKTHTLVTARFTVKKIKMKGFNVLVTMGILNPTSNTIKLNSFVGSIVSDNRDIATITNFTPVTIAGNNESEITLTFIPSALGVVSLLRNLISMPLGKIGVKLLGSANIDGYVLPVNIDF